LGRERNQSKTRRKENVIQALQVNDFTTYKNLKLTRDAKGILVAQFHTDGAKPKNAFRIFFAMPPTAPWRWPCIPVRYVPAAFPGRIAFSGVSWFNWIVVRAEVGHDEFRGLVHPAFRKD
jgi:hypothetical protein